jgi:hypothetical protein
MLSAEGIPARATFVTIIKQQPSASSSRQGVVVWDQDTEGRPGLVRGCATPTTGYLLRCLTYLPPNGNATCTHAGRPR